MKTAVVFFSLEGNTRFAAENIAKMLDADVIEIKPLKPYPTGNASKFFFGGKASTFKESPKLETYAFNADDYDIVIVGSPLWAWNIAPPLRTFLKENNLSGKKVAAFISCGGGDAAKAFEEIRNLLNGIELTQMLKLVNPLNDKDSAVNKIEEFCGMFEYSII